MGTALTTAQANLLARYTGKALLLYDSDMAGLRATFRTADALLQAGVHPLVVTLPEGEDPDSLVRQAVRSAAAAPGRGRGRARAQAADAGGARLLRRHRGHRRALDRLLPTLRATVDPALRDIYTARIAQRTGVRRETLERTLEKAAAAGPHEFEWRCPAG
jgi:DNA primase